MSERELTQEELADKKIAEAQARRDARKAHVELARKIQLAADIEVLDRLEEEHGHERVIRIDLIGWDDKVPAGTPTMVIAKVPTQRAVYRRHNDQIANAVASKDGKAAVDAKATLGRSCLIYPNEKDHPEQYKAVMDLTGEGILVSVGNQISAIMDGRSASEGKG